ncbi:MAG: peptidylprolyl isomerase [Chlorobi bacterium]|nr:peptidylprolyl isomerase [Chlorobiota bacterium]
MRLLWVAVSLSAILVCSVTAQPSRKSPQTKSASEHSPSPTTVLARVGPEVVTYADIEMTYLRNANRKNRSLMSVPKDSVLEFLRLFTNYRLKVLDAISRGYDKDSSILSEVTANRRLVAETFLYEKRVIEPNVEIALQRRAFEVKPAVIVISIPQGDNADTTAAYAKAKTCLQLVQRGESFEQVAKDSSDDKETAQNGGVLPYITALSGVVRPLEDALFGIEPGHVYPSPIRTRFVYIIAKLLEKRPRQLVRVRHILLAPTEELDSAALERRADSLVTALQRASAEQFADAARKFSSDKSTSANGGLLGNGGFYCRSLGFENDNRRLLPQFEDVLFSLRDGQVGIARTIYGIHIVRRDTTKQYNPEEERENVRRLYRRYNFEDDKRALLDAEKKKAGWLLREHVLASFLGLVNPTRSTRDSAWDASIGEPLRTEVLYSFGARGGLTLGAFIDSLKKRREPHSLNRQGITTAINKITDPLIVEQLTVTLESQYPEFARLVREFRDGILLFKVEDQEVWSKLKFDTVLARAYYDSTQSRYRTEHAFDVSEIYVLSDSIARELASKARQTTTREEFDRLAEEYTQRPGFREKKGHWGKATLKSSPLISLVSRSNPSEGEIVGPLKFENGYSIVRVNAVYPPRQKTFEEAIPDIASAVQEIKQRQLTEQWLGALRKRFPVRYETATINKLFGR